MKSKLEKLDDIVNGVSKEENGNIRVFVGKLKILLGERYVGFTLPPDGDRILERCIRHRKYNMNQAVDQVYSYFNLFYDVNKMKNENLFLPSVHQKYFFDSFSLGILKEKDPTGTPIVFVNFETMPGETFCIAKVLAIFIMMLTELIYQSVDTKNMGAVILVNMKGFKTAHAKQYSLSRLRTISKVLQGAVPVSFKALHCINTPTIALWTYELFKPFLRQKLKDRIHLHGNDRTEFNTVVDKSFLPIALEGDLPNEEAVDDDFVFNLCKKDEYYREFSRYGCTALEKGKN